MLNDDELIEQIKKGNDQAAEELINRYYKSILRYCKALRCNISKYS